MNFNRAKDSLSGSTVETHVKYDAILEFFHQQPLSHSNPHPNLHVRYGDKCFISDRASKSLAEASLPERLEYTMPDQNAVESLFLPSIIVRKGDARKNRRPRANNTSLHPKRKLSKSISKESPTSETLCGSSLYLL